jgi:hypothetical protein
MRTLRRYWNLSNLQRNWPFRVLPGQTTNLGCEVLALPWNCELRNV